MEPIVYTTVNKLIKQNKLKKSDLLNNKLKSEAAKRLYKDNIRVHKRHYIPKDIKKYFHEEELKGEGLFDALKKIGTTIKHTLTNKSEATEKVDKYVKTVLQGRENFPPKVRTILEKVGDKPVTNINIVRTPVQKVLVEVLNIVSLGAFKERLKQTPYDTLFHLRVDITVEGGQKVSLEKNEVINMEVLSNPLKDENPTVSSNSETRQIQNLIPGLTINSMLNKAREIQGDKFFKYSAYDNNCQDFIIALLQGSNIGTSDDYNFIKQSVQQLFTGVSKKFANFVTTLGRKFNELTKGAGLKGSSVVQSVLFDKDKYTIKEAINWLKKHDFEGREVDEKENTLRFRQVDPDELENYSFRTKEISDGINFVIAYKTRKTNNKYMLKTKELNSEKEIIRKLNKMQDRIRAHHAQTGTVGAGIFDAFAGLGESIKNLFTPAYENAKDYVTRKQGGLASDIVHKGIPLVVGEVAEKATNYIPGLGAVVDGRQEGRKLGKQLSDYIGQTTGVGVKQRRKKSDKQVVETMHIDINSHNAETGGKNKMGGDGVRKKRGRKPMKELSYEKYSHAKNEPLRQLIEAREEQADKQLKKDLGAALKKITGGGLDKAPKGRLKKGSPEAKEWARKMREARNKK